MAALRIHHHGVNQPRVALPFEPGAFGSSGGVEAAPLFDHQPFMTVNCRALGAQRGQILPAGERQQAGQVKARAGVGHHPGLKPRPPFRQRQVAQILAAVEQHVIGPDEGRIVLQV